MFFELSDLVKKFCLVEGLLVCLCICCWIGLSVWITVKACVCGRVVVVRGGVLGGVWGVLLDVIGLVCDRV